MKHELAFTYSNGVPCVVASLIPRNDVKVRRENINNLAFALVAPLGSDYNDVFHNNSGTGHTSKREGVPSGAFSIGPNVVSAGYFFQTDVQAHTVDSNVCACELRLCRNTVPELRLLRLRARDRSFWRYSL